MLDDIEVACEYKFQTPDLGLFDFVVDGLVNALRRQRLAQLLRMSRLTASFAFLAAARFLLFRLRFYDIA